MGESPGGGSPRPVVAYTPTNNANLVTKTKFYDSLEDITRVTNKRDLLFMLEDFNAESGGNRTGLTYILGPHGSPSTNENTDLFQEPHRIGDCQFVVQTQKHPLLDLDFQ